MSISSLHQVLICGMHAILQLCQFWSTFKSELANKGPYQASIGSMRFRLQELQKTNSEAQKLRSKEGYKKVKGVIYHQGLLFVPKAIQTKLISRYHNDSLAGHFGIKKTCELLAQKYFWPSWRHNVEVNVKGCDMCLASKAVKHKPYGDFQSLLIPTYWWNNLSMDFMTGLHISTN